MTENENKIKKQSFPMLASVHWSPEDDDFEDRRKWFEEFLKMDAEIRYGLSDERISQAILNFAKKYNIYTKEYIGEISRIIRGVYSRGIKEEEIKRRMLEKLNVKEENLELLMSDLKRVILLVKEIGTEEKRKEEQKERESYQTLDIKTIAQKYPLALEQLISSSKIKIEMYDRPVRPSIKNWLEDYREKAGTGSHTSMQRNHYLFDTDNTRNLRAQERQTLADLIESYDEGRKLLINTSSGKINFEKRDIVKQGIEMEKREAKMTIKPNADIKTQVEVGKNSSLKNRMSLLKKEQPPIAKKLEIKSKDNAESRQPESKKPDFDKKEKRNILDLSDY